MQYDTEKIKAINGFIVHPIWPEEKVNGIIQFFPPELKLGQQPITDAKNPASLYYPTKGIIISSPEGFPTQKGDILYFTWSAFVPDQCISDAYNQNIWPIRYDYYAYERNGKINTLSEFFLIDPVFEQEEVVSKSGIIISGLQVSGSVSAPVITTKKIKRKLRGKIRFLPEELSDNLKILKQNIEVLIMQTSDIPITVNGESLYRTRLSEVLGYYNENKFIPV